MAGKKPVTKARKTTKPAATRKAEPASARKPAAAKPVARTAAKGAHRKPVVARAVAKKPAVKGVPAPKLLRPAVTSAVPQFSVRPPPVTEADEGDAHEPGSLLAGPRNVKPYIAKRGERYMSKEQLAHFRHILQNWKRDLMVEVDRTVTHMKDEAANFPDPNDRATQEEEFSLELRTRDRERKLIRKIDEALKRTEDGSYGYCLETGEEIGIKRLEARPVATLSIEAQERRERRERQYGDRDDRYR